MTRAATPETIDEAKQEILELRQALESRSVIDQAKGLIRAYLCCDEQTAFRALRAASQRANVKVRTLATEVVELASDCSRDSDRWMAEHIGPPGARAS